MRANWNYIFGSKNLGDMQQSIKGIQSDVLESTIGYQLAIAFKPFINPKCSEHMEIVKDMARSINSAFRNNLDNGAVFAQGYNEGKIYNSEILQQEYKRVMELNKTLQAAIDNISKLTL